MELKGICASKGYGCGKAAVKRDWNDMPEKYAVLDTKAEETRFQKARAGCKELFSRMLEASDGLGDEAKGIFNAYLAILGDEIFFKNPLDRIITEKLNIEYLLYDEYLKVEARFNSIGDAYLRERAADIENVVNELIRFMSGRKDGFAEKSFSEGDVIAVARSLSPQEAMNMDKTLVKGFITEQGGAASHTVILARALGIPAVVAVKGALELIKDGDFLLLDGGAGTVEVNPDLFELAGFKAKSENEDIKQKIYYESAGLPAVTLDGRGINVGINIDGESLRGASPGQCDGVGLFRTEYLYMGRNSYPDEETQYTAYSGVVSAANGKRTVIRTLDIGGDKQAGYMNLPKEDNPFLGLRGIRLCLRQKEMFMTQLRAILRASAGGGVELMFPMITTLEELIEAKACVDEAKDSLLREKIPFNPDIPVGIMIETPSAVFLSGKLARESDFFCIGTNDLIQYITASDRCSESVGHLYSSLSPPVLNAVRIAAKAAENASIPWGICGEAASEARLIPLWAALGASDLSVAPSQVGEAKYLVRRLDLKAVMPKVLSVLDMPGAEQVKKVLDDVLESLMVESL